MPVLSTLEMLFYYFPFAQLSVWHLKRGGKTDGTNRQVILAKGT